MGNAKFSKEFEVHYYEINKHREVTPVSLLNFLEDSAISHSKYAGYGVEKLKAEGIGWLLKRWVLKMDRYPVLNEKILITTWPSEFKRFYASREFVISDVQGGVIGKATSLWIYFNLEKKRPVRIPDNMSKEYNVGCFAPIGLCFNEISDIEDAQNEKRFAVRMTDIDTNNHVNNSKYVGWVLESLPGDMHDNFTLSSLEVDYIKETCYGSIVASTSKKSGTTEDGCEYIHKIKSESCGYTAALARTVWKEREHDACPL